MNPQSRPLSGASVQLTESNTQAVRRVSSNELGIFQITGLAPGDYELAVQAPGFATLTQKLRLEVGQQMTLDVGLKLPSVQNTVNVADVAPALHTTDAAIGEVIEPTSIKELPLNGRMLIDLVLTVPGAHVSHGAQTGDMNPLYWRPGQRSAVSIGGNRPNANYFLLDGTTNTDPTFNTLNLSPSPDAVQEFKVQTGSYSAEMGGAGGGQINIVTRSGSNQFHGTVYEFLRNDLFDASTFDSMGNNHLAQNNFGASFGGPLVRNKTFFFLNYEGFRHAMADTMIDTVPTQDEINGDFSMSGVDIFDPTNSRQQFQYNGVLNVIPPDQINLIAQKFLQTWVPMPNVGMGMGMDMTMPCGGAMMGQPGVIGAGVDCNNYFDVRNELQSPTRARPASIRYFGNGDRLTGRYSASAENGFMPQNLPGFGVHARQLFAARQHFMEQDHQPAHGEHCGDHRVPPLHAAQRRERLQERHRLGTWHPGNRFRRSRRLGCALVQCPGLLRHGRHLCRYAHARLGHGPRRPRHPELAASAATALKFGGSYRHYIWPMWGFFQNRGYYQFTNGFTTQPAPTTARAQRWPAFCSDCRPSSNARPAFRRCSCGSGTPTDSFRTAYQVTPTTTVELGLRYEYMSPLVDISYANSNLTFVNGVPFAFIGGQNGFPKGLKYPNPHNFAPRLGISQNIPSRGLVLHAAYGIFFTPVDMNTWCNQRHNVPYRLSGDAAERQLHTLGFPAGLSL